MVGASAALAGGFLVAGAAQSATVAADSVAPIERAPVRAPSIEPAPPATTATQPAATTTTQPEAPVTALAETPVAPTVTNAATEAPAEVAAPVEATVPAPVNQSSCRNDLPGAAMTIAMPAISYTCSVYAGGQSVIDAGAATMISAEHSDLPLAARPGDAP